jgi:hypothetical protein
MEQFKALFLLFAFGWLFLGAAYPVSAQQSVLSSQTSRDPSEIISMSVIR